MRFDEKYKTENSYKKSINALPQGKDTVVTRYTELVYNNKIYEIMNSILKIYATNLTIFSILYDNFTYSKGQLQYRVASNWYQNWGLGHLQ